LKWEREFNMTREDIKECLSSSEKSEDCRKLLAFCKEPQAYGQLGKIGVRDVIGRLVDLKKAGALSFDKGKYFATQEALEVLESIQ
jgi:hypothetical protein